MPDFDKNLDPIIKETSSIPGYDVRVQAPKKFSPMSFSSDGGSPDLASGKGVFGELEKASRSSNFGEKGVFVTGAELKANQRYSYYNPTINNYEDFVAHGQSTWDKAANGILKGANLAATTVAGGFGMLYGIGKWAMPGGKFSDVYSNEVMSNLDNWNNKVDNELLPNYYTDAEKNAAWYSTDNWLTANFLFDKLIKNSGFAVGAMVSGNLANAGLMRLGTAIGQTAAKGAILAESAQGFKLFSPLLRNTARAFSAGKNIEAAAILEKEISSIADLSTRTSKLAEIAKTTNKIADFSDNFRRTTIALYSSAGEASFEALQTAKEYKNNLIQKYKENFGVEPTGDALKDIEAQTAQVGKISFLGNMALLGATEFQQLPYLLGSSYKSTRTAANSLIGATEDVVLKEGKYVAKSATSRFGKIYDKVTGVGKYFFDPKEAGQEVGQYAIQVGTQNYFNKGSEGQEASLLVDGLLYGFFGKDERGEGVGALVSKEGMESLVLGGLTGGLMQAKGLYQESREKGKDTQKLLNSLNSAPSFKDAFQDRMRSINRGVVLQQQEQAAIINGDELEAKDLRHDMTHNYLMSRIKYGRFDMVMDDINELRTTALTESGLAALKEQGFANINDTVEQYTQRLNAFEATAKNTNEIYDSLNLRYSGVLNKKGERAYPSEVIDKMAYAASKVANYDDRIPQVSQSLLNAGIDISTPLNDVLIDGVPKEDAVSKTLGEIDSLSTKLTEDEVLDLKRDFRDLIELGIRRKEFLKEYNDISKNPSKYTTAPQKPSAETKDKGPITTTTPSGEMAFEVGKQYYLGTPVKRTKKGVKHEKFSRFIVLGESPDGKMVIQVSSGDPSVDGEIFEVKKDFFSEVDVNDISTVEDKPNAKFYTEVVGKKFTYQLGKGKSLEGEIRYDIKTGRLFFVTSDGKKKYGVTRDMFKPKEGYEIAKIYTEEELSDRAQEALDAEISEEDLIAQFEERDAILGEAVAGTKEKLDQVNANLETAKETLKKTEEEISKLTTTKTGEPKTKFTKANRKVLENLRKLHKYTSDSIESLTEERDNLQELSDYFQELYNKRGDLPATFDEAMKGFKETLGNLKEVIADTSEAIKNGETLIGQVESAIETAMALFNDYIKNLREKNPKLPLFLEDLQNQIEKYLGPEGAKNYIQERLGFTEAVMELEDQINDFSEQLNLPNMTSKATKLAEQVRELNAGLNELAAQAIPKEAAINALTTIAEDYRKRVKEEERLAKSEKLVKRFLQTSDTGVQTEMYDSEYEPDRKKSDLHTVTGTTVPSVEYNGAPLAPHHVRANTFGANMDKMPNRENLRGIIVTSKNEKNVLPGLTKFLKDNGNKDIPVDPDETIALVIVEIDPEDETIKRLVGVDGKPLASPDLNAAIFQVFPKDLTWSDGKSMFRKSTPKEVVEDLTNQYEKWRTETLKNPSTDTYSFDASFGIPDPVVYLDDKGDAKVDETARTSVQDAGLIDENDLLRDPVIEIPTSEGALENGSVSFAKPLGRPFLALKNGYVKLKNRLLTKQEAATVYQAIERLATEVNESEDGIDSEGAQLMINYLKSIIYWGTPREGKAVGRNNVFFEREGDGGLFSRLTLNIGGKGYNIPFTPTAIKAKKDEITSLLENIYNNINQKMTESKWAEPFVEVLSISPEGKVETREWPNYQSYLLSNKLPDGGARNVDEIPLVTDMRPLKDSDDVNRSGIYFIVDYGKEKFVSSKGVKKKRIKPGALEEEGGKEEKKLKLAPEGTYILDGETVNILVLPESKRKIYFTANRELILKKDIKNGIKIAFGVGDAKAIQDELMEKGMTKEETLSQFRGNIFIAIKNKLSEKKVTSDTKFVVEDDEDGDVEDSEAFNKLFGKKEKKKIEEIEKEEEEEENDNTEEDTDKFGSFSVDDDEELKDDLDNLDDDVPFRQIVESRIKRFEGENWKKVENWLNKTFPNVPVYRVKNVLKSTNGEQAWGMFKNGAIYIYENAEVGTTYHEVFHAVWRMFSDTNERAAVLNELRSRKGTFYDVRSGNTLNYSDPNVTEKQLEEVLAEEFKDYIQEGKIPARPTYGKNWIQRLFADLKNFIREFFLGKNAGKNTANLFEKISTGYYKNYSPYHASLSYAKTGIIDIDQAYASDDAAFSIANFTGEQVHDIMQEMTYLTLGRIIKNNESLFNLPNIDRQELYDDLRVQIRRTVLKPMKAAQESVRLGTVEQKDANVEIAKSLAMRDSIKNDVTWKMLIEKHEEYLRKYSIEFDENDSINLKDDANSGRGEYDSSDKIDHFRKANAAIKLILSTIPVVKEVSKTRPEGGEVMVTESIPSSIGGHTLLPTIEAFVKIMNKTYDSRNIEDMLARIKEMAKTDPNYRTVYTRLTRRNYTTPGIDLSNMKEAHDTDLLNALWRTFKKQNPDVKNHYILDNGDVQVGDANMATAARQAKLEMMNSIVKVLKGRNKYFKEDTSKKAFVQIKGGIDSVDLDNMEDRVKFLRTLGISFRLSDIKKLNRIKQDLFRRAVSGIRDSLKNAKEIATISSKTLNMDGRLLELGEVKAAIENPEFDTTYFGGNGERKQTFIGTNAASDFYDALSQVDNLNDIPKLYPQYAYLLTDEFVNGSVILDRMFLPNGERRANSEDLMKASIADSTIDSTRGMSKESSKLTYRDRLIQEINMNIEGYQYALVPGDASLEWMFKMVNATTPDSLLYGMSGVYKIFERYLISEIDLSRNASRTIADVKGRNKKDLRFFKAILGEDLHNKITSQTKDKALNRENSELSAQDLYNQYESEIIEAIDSFVKKETESLKDELINYEIIESGTDGWTINNLDYPTNENVKDETLNRRLTSLTVNYMVNNIELHKLLFSDPYQYSDELKRIKNFLSPRQAIMYGSKKLNAIMNNVHNKDFASDDIGRTDFTKDYFKSATLSKVYSVSDLDLYKDPYEEGDGGGAIIYKSYRNFRIRAGEWTSKEEKQYRYDIAWEKRDKGLKLSKDEQKLLEEGNPEVKSAYTTLKPIVSGNKDDGKNYNDILLDKFALYPLSYRVMKETNPTSNAVKLYNKMQKEGIDYVVFESGRKVGSKETHSLYNKGGKFNTEKFGKDVVVNVPFAIMSVQAEVPSKEENDVTRGTQVTKLVTMDMMEGGVPIDFDMGEPDFNKRYELWNSFRTEEQREEASPLYKEIKRNEKLLIELIEEGYRNLLKKFDIKETVSEDGRTFQYELTDIKKTMETLKSEVLNREVNDNIISALKGFESGSAIIEATPAYQQIRNILYSIADRNVISQKINGGMKVQLPSTLLESVRAEAQNINGKDVYTSDILKFYVDKDGQRVCELMVSRWFDSDLSDDELLRILNTTPEGQQILSGIAYRIPTQKQNSIDAFRIAKFLPKEFGDNVIVPSALVKKVGSDFDIDKLSMYLKNVYIDSKEVPRLIKFENIDTNNESQLKSFYENNLLERYKRFRQVEKEAGVESSVQDLLEAVLNVEDLTESIMSQARFKYVPSIDEFLVEAKGMDVYELNRKFHRFNYKKVLENEYIDSMEKLVTNPLNFESLTKPNSADELKALSGFIVDKLNLTKFDYTQVGNMLSRAYMSNLRHAFVTGKYAIGIAAVNQTNHSMNQRSLMYIDLNRLEEKNRISEGDKKWLKDGKLKFFTEDGENNFNTVMNADGEEVTTLSMIKNKAGRFISDLIAQFIDGYVDISKDPWIMQLGATPNVASTYLFLIKTGVPIKSVVYFMNQPIIRDYLRSLENAGYTWVFNQKFVSAVKNSEKYKIGDSAVQSVEAIPVESRLEKFLGQTEFSKDEKAQQQFILDEFLKYAKMAEHLFFVTQGTNFDTSNFNDPYLVLKKEQQLIKAQDTIISSVNNILDNSFLGVLRANILKFRNAYATILKSDQPGIRNVISKVLLPYTNLSDREFVKVAQKAVADLFDWAVQTDFTTKANVRLNAYIERALLADDNYVRQIDDFVQAVRADENHPLYNNQIIKVLQPVLSDRVKGVDNLKIKGRDNKVYDQNQIIYAFTELKNHLEGIDSTLYRKLTTVAVLQSGLSNSPISFTSLLPYEDFKEIYNNVLSQLDEVPNLDLFYDLHIFERNNWANDDLVPHSRAKLFQSKSGDWFYNTNMNFLSAEIRNAVADGKIPQLLTMSRFTREGNYDFIVYNWEDESIPLNDRKAMKRRGDFSYIKKGLFKKVKDKAGNPLIYTTESKGVMYENFVYQAINAWGDSFRANEFYTSPRQSKIDNGFIKVKEVGAEKIIPYFFGKASIEEDVILTAQEFQTIEIDEFTIQLKDGNYYLKDQVDASFLERLNYSRSEIGTILTKLC